MNLKGCQVLKELWSWLNSFLFAVLLLAVISIFIFPARVSGESMKDTLQDGDILLVARHISIRQGDIVVIDKPGFKRIVKRVIGIPGDVITIDNKSGQVLRNGRILSENYVSSETFAQDILGSTVALQDNEYFVLGDNRKHSTDSRSEHVGIVSKNELLGKVVYHLDLSF